MSFAFVPCWTCHLPSLFVGHVVFYRTLLDISFAFVLRGFCYGPMLDMFLSFCFLLDTSFSFRPLLEMLLFAVDISSTWLLQ